MPTLNTVIKQASRGADLYFVFRFLRLLTMKYERTDAYKYGIIDKKGKPLKKSSELETVDEKASYTMLHRLVFKVRRLIEKVPVLGKSILLNYAAALFLLKEQDNKRIWTDENYMERELNKFLESDWEEEADQLKEAFRGQYGKTQADEFLIEGDPCYWGDTKSLKKYKKMTPGESVNEREMTDAEKKKREEIVLSLKKKKKDFQDRYGDDWENVMYATATKMAMGEDMKKFTEFQEAERGPCWVGYVQQGMKKKGGKLVPNCVPEQVGVRKVDFVDGVTEDSPPPVNAAPTAPDSGNIQYQEPVLGKKKKKKKIDEAKIITSTFAGKQVFVVDSDMYHQCRLGKQKYHRYEKYVGNKRIGKAIREYGLKHPKRPIILQNGENGPMLYLRYGRS
jgi:hypothetical protein